MKFSQVRPSRDYLLRPCCRKGVGYHHLLLAETQRYAEGCIVKKKEKASGIV
jgi:hypothetical protein